MKRYRSLIVAAAAVPLALSLGAWTLPSSSMSSLSSSGGSSVDEVDPADNLPDYFDLQSHRFGRGEWTEQSALGIAGSQALDVTTLEFDIVIAEDGTPVVWHDPTIQDDKCTDTEPAFADDPEFPYVGDLVHELTWEQLRTLNCNLPLEDYPDAEHPKVNRLLQLRDVFELTEDDDTVHYNIETKREYTNPAGTATPEEFVDAILPVVDAYGVNDRTMIQSFDWSTLALVREQAPEIPTVVLTGGPLTAGAPYLGPVDAEAAGDNFGAAQQLAAQVMSPSYSEFYFDDNGEVDPERAQAYIDEAHAHDLLVVPYTVNDEQIMRDLIDLGVDGIITDYPTRLAAVLTEKGISW